MMIELNEFQRLGTLIAHRGLFKSVKSAFLNDPKCQKGVFLDWGLWDRLDIAHGDRNKWVTTCRNLIAHEGSFKHVENAFLNDPEGQKWGFWPFLGLRSFGLTWYCILW